MPFVFRRPYSIVYSQYLFFVFLFFFYGVAGRLPFDPCICAVFCRELLCYLCFFKRMSWLRSLHPVLFIPIHTCCNLVYSFESLQVSGWAEPYSTPFICSCHGDEFGYDTGHLVAFLFAWGHLSWHALNMTFFVTVAVLMFSGSMLVSSPTFNNALSKLPFQGDRLFFQCYPGWHHLWYLSGGGSTFPLTIAAVSCWPKSSVHARILVVYQCAGTMGNHVLSVSLDRASFRATSLDPVRQCHDIGLCQAVSCNTVWQQHGGWIL